MEPDSNPAWPPPPGATSVQPYSAAKGYRTFMAFFAALDESDPYSPSVAVEGKQYVTGRVERWISVYAPAGERLSSFDAFRLARFLLDAADALDRYK